jgi:outer membrane protein assembly factor BamB
MRSVLQAGKTVRHMLLWGAIAAVAVADDWPAFLGPHGDGSSDEKGLNLAWGETGPPVLWRKSLGESFSPPVVADGKLIVFHRLGDQEVVECVDARSGATLWSARYGTRYVDRYGYNGGPRSSPTISEARVFTYGAEGVVSCWELASGRCLWQRRLHDELKAPQEFFGVGTAPVVDGGLVLLNPGAPGGAGLVALDMRNGASVWHSGDCGASYSTGKVVSVRGQRRALFLTRNGLFVVVPATGQVLTRFPFQSHLQESVNAASPVVVGSQVLLSAAYEVGSVMFDLGADDPQPVWRDRDVMQNHWATSICRDGCLYGLHGRHAADAVMRCLDWHTGALRWTSPRLRERLTLLLADGHFIALGERGRLLAVEVNPTQYVPKADARLLDGPCWAPPVLASGLLYVRNEVVLLCLDLRPTEPVAGRLSPGR